MKYFLKKGCLGSKHFESWHFWKYRFCAYIWMLVQWGTGFNRTLGWTVFSLNIWRLVFWYLEFLCRVYWNSDFLKKDLFLFSRSFLDPFLVILKLHNVTWVCICFCSLCWVPAEPFLLIKNFTAISYEKLFLSFFLKNSRVSFHLHFSLSETFNIGQSLDLMKDLRGPSRYLPSTWTLSFTWLPHTFPISLSLNNSSTFFPRKSFHWTQSNQKSS